MVKEDLNTLLATKTFVSISPQNECIRKYFTDDIEIFSNFNRESSDEENFDEEILENLR